MGKNVGLNQSPTDVGNPFFPQETEAETLKFGRRALGEKQLDPSLFFHLK